MLHVVLATVGRPTLPCMLETIRMQLAPEDRFWVIIDRKPTDPAAAAVEAAVEGFGLNPDAFLFTGGPHRDYGHTARNSALPLIKEYAGGRGSVFQVDDDDVLAPRALAGIRAEVCRHGDDVPFLMFRFEGDRGDLTWVAPEVARRNCGTGMFVFPLRATLAKFSRKHDGDFKFIRDTIVLNPTIPVVFRPEIGLLLRPERRKNAPPRRDLAVLDGPHGRPDKQADWHRVAAETIPAGATILDVGAGLALSLDRLRSGGHSVTTQDVAPGMPVDIREPVERIADRSFDYVTAFDVVEHVRRDGPFLRELFRIARRGLFVTTPNYRVSKAKNPHHVREYSPPQFLHALTVARDPDCRNATSCPRDGRWTTFVRPRGGRPVEVDFQAFMESEAANLGVFVR